MRIQPINPEVSGEWSRDCELRSLTYGQGQGLQILYHKDSDDTNWRLRCEHVVSYKYTGEDFSILGYLSELPDNGSFFEILDSVWIKEFRNLNISVNCKHVVLQFYDETIEIIAQNFLFERFEKPI